MLILLTVVALLFNGCDKVSNLIFGSPKEPVSTSDSKANPKEEKGSLFSWFANSKNEASKKPAISNSKSKEISTNGAKR